MKNVFAASKVKERHDLILEVTGHVFKEEERAHWLATEGWSPFQMSFIFNSSEPAKTLLCTVVLR